MNLADLSPVASSGPASEPVNRRTTVDGMLTAFRSQFEAVLSPPVAIAILTLAVDNRESDLKPRPGQEAFWRTHLLEAMREASEQRLLAAFDQLRDILVARLAFKFPPLFMQCRKPPSYDGLYTLHAQVHSLLTSGRFDDLLQLANPALAELSMAYGQDHDFALRQHRHAVARACAAPGARPRYLPAADCLMAPLYDGRRVRLLCADATHANTVCIQRNAVPPQTTYEWGAIYGFVNSRWQVVGFD